jgi:hypothetical protein
MRKDGQKNLPGQGRKPKLGTMLKIAMEKYHGNFDKITEETIAKALPQSLKVKCPKCKHEWEILKVAGTGDKDMLQYINDRVLGRPTQSVDHRVTAQVIVSAEEYETARRIAVVDETKLLNEVIIEGECNAIQESGAGEGSSEDTATET